MHNSKYNNINIDSSNGCIISRMRLTDNASISTVEGKALSSYSQIKLYFCLIRFSFKVPLNQRR